MKFMTSSGVVGILTTGGVPRSGAGPSYYWEGEGVELLRLTHMYIEREMFCFFLESGGQLGGDGFSWGGRMPSCSP